MSWHLGHHEGLPYRFHLPRGYDPSQRRHPLVVYLHGSGERGDDGERHLKNGVDALERYEVIAVAPQCPRDDTWGGSWYGGESAAQRKVASLVRELRSKRSVDARHVCLIGFSMGGIGAWELLSRHRALFSAAAVIASDLEPGSARSLEGFPLWAFHGERDELVSNAAIRRVAALLPSPFRYTEVPNEGHDAWRAAFGNPELIPWLLSHRSPC